MLMTEAEAKTKWCPFFRASVAKAMSEDVEYATNRDGRYEETGKGKIDCCIGSACMAWRWERRMSIDAVKAIREARGVSIHEAIHLYRESFVGEQTTNGYCGASGRIEA